MIFDILEAKLAAAGLGTPGVNIFRGFMPAEVTIGIMSRDPLQGIPVDQEIPGWYRGDLQFIVRHVDPVEGLALANRVIKALIVQTPENYPATEERGAARIVRFFPSQLPIKYPLLVGNGIEWSLHFDTAFTLKSDWT